MQKGNYKRINTQSLLKNFTAYMDNLSITENGLRLSDKSVYKFGTDIIDDSNLHMSDIAIDECDTVYIIDQKSRSIRTIHEKFGTLKNPVYDSRNLAEILDTPCGIGVDENSIYVADSDKQKVISFAKTDLQVRWTVSKGPEGLPLKDLVDLAAGLDGNIYVLEKGRKRILRLDKNGNIVDEIGKGELSDPKNIYLDRQGNIHVLDGDEYSFIFKVDGTYEKRIAEYSLLQNLSRKRASDSKNNLYLINDSGNKLTFFTYTEENTTNQKGSFQGTYISKRIDSQTPKTRWHRFLLEGNFLEGTNIEFLYYISDKPLNKKYIENIEEHEWHKGIAGSSSIQGERRRDALFQADVEGQYLWFKIILMGTETLSPVISSITLFFPRISYLDYLPEIYREDPAGRDFLDRFLSIFESMFFEIDFSIDHLSRSFDAEGTPPQFLDWLCSWISFPLDENWPETRKQLFEEKKRSFISKAVSIYKKRGTKEGLEELIELYTGKKPIIVEIYPTNSLEEKQISKIHEVKDTMFFPPKEAKVKLPIGRGEAYEKEIALHDLLFGKERFCFYVLFKDPVDEATLDLIRTIIEEQKPAHMSYKLKVLEPWFYLDAHTYLGINTALTKPDFVLGKTSVVGRDTALGGREMDQKHITQSNYSKSVKE
ncbi:phage tail protein [Methanolobus sp. ZRKC3]|uniref:phage tail protein n=1 Tax=Methanolobus sp. ZRKC3 TaxID=3125786 RepID=UPI00324A9217